MLDVLWMFFGYSLDVHWMFFGCSLDVLPMFFRCSLVVLLAFFYCYYPSKTATISQIQIPYMVLHLLRDCFYFPPTRTAMFINVKVVWLNVNPREWNLPEWNPTGNEEQEERKMKRLMKQTTNSTKFLLNSDHRSPSQHSDTTMVRQHDS